jgi:exopolysaccharide biosynthesis polyprenyl glycosylphosphotransferase
MHRRDLLLFRKALIAFDLASTAAAFLVTLYFRQWLADAATVPGALPTWVNLLEVGPVSQPHQYYLLLAGIIPVWFFAFYVSNTSDFRCTYQAIAVRYARALAIGLSIFLSAFFMLKLQFIARTFVVMFAMTNFVALLVGRFLIMELLAFVRSKRVDGHRVVIVGCGEAALRCAESLNSQPPWAVRLLGHVSVPGERALREIPRKRILTSLDQLHELLDATPVDEVLFASTAVDEELLANALQTCDERGLDVLLPLPPAIPQRARVEIASIDGFELPLLGLRRTPTSEVGLALKRAVDVVGGIAALLLAAPVMVLVAIGIKATSSGPVLFKQVRAGRNGRQFVMFKFRSMVVDAEAKKAALMHLNEMSGPVFKIRRDPRVTRIGALIRKTSLDELPQLFNIVLGDMSLVGPRPPLPSEVEQYKPWQRRRLSVKPGLTGLWQVSGRNDVDFEEWMALDLRYIDDWSLWLDMKILLRTLPAVLFKTGAS